MEKLPHYYFSWIVSSRNRDNCEMLPLDTKQSGDKLLPLSDLRGGSVSRGDTTPSKLQRGLQTEAEDGEGTSQLQDRNLKLKDLESRRKTRKFEGGDANERSIWARC
jgi:hypothetical protein